ncbi:MAG TPA: muconolactone Delta-isomerase family protein [Vicinamibacteria bacterium]|nr:muconolactone Delta-isomerase family protein [Vicinamibacteria bacterium]
MLFLVELDHVKSAVATTPEAARAFVEQVIFPTLARAERLVTEKKILSGGAVAGRIALRFVMEADSAEHVDRLVTSLPIWPLAETRVTPLITLAERREHVKALLESLPAAK